jgi:unsaturated rhamnogalacturonyl hydrolase
MNREENVVSKNLLQKIVKRTMQLPFRMWGFGEAIALQGLLAAAEHLQEDHPRGFVEALVRMTLARGIGSQAEDHVAPGMSMLALYRNTREEIFLAGARSLAALHAAMPESPQGGRLHRAYQPGWRQQIWVDHLDVDPPFLAALFAVTNEERYLRQSLRELLAYLRLLQDEHSGLLYHGYETACGQNGEFWARGNGWALMGILETLRWTPADEPDRPEIVQRLIALLEGLQAVQNLSGLWHTVLQDPETYQESTLAVMCSYALGKHADHHPELRRFSSMAQKAHAAVLQQVNADGELQLVSDATPIGTRRMYATRAFGVFAWGQGPLLLLASQKMETLT